MQLMTTKGCKENLTRHRRPSLFAEHAFTLHPVPIGRIADIGWFPSPQLLSCSRRRLYKDMHRRAKRWDTSISQVYACSTQNIPSSRAYKGLLYYSVCMLGLLRSSEFITSYNNILHSKGLTIYMPWWGVGILPESAERS